MSCWRPNKEQDEDQEPAKGFKIRKADGVSDEVFINL
jgi:hypothetical protein